MASVFLYLELMPIPWPERQVGKGLKRGGWLALGLYHVLSISLNSKDLGSLLSLLNTLSLVPIDR